MDKNTKLEKPTVEESAVGTSTKEYIEDESKGYTVVFYSWEDDRGRPRVAGRFHTKEEKDAFIEEIKKPDSGWLTEELETVSVENDYWYMLPA